MADKEKIQDFEDFITALDAMNELAESFWEQDEKERACLTEAQIFESARKILGPEHPGTMNAMHNYALGLAKTGRDKEASAVLNEYIELADRINKEKKSTEK